MLGKSQWAGFSVFVLIAALVPIGATEPEGFFRLRTTWIEGGEPVSHQPRTTERTARFQLAPVGDVTSARVTVLVPSEIQARFRGPWEEAVRELPPVDGRRAFRLDLGALGSGEAIRIGIGFSPPGDGGGIVSFVVDGTTPQGRPVREAVGWSVGHPGPQPLRRHGAVEFPIVPVPETP